MNLKTFSYRYLERIDTYIINIQIGNNSKSENDISDKPSY
jgi:hypothetical protein